MWIEGVIWLEAIVDKVESKHHVTAAEVEDVLAAQPRFRFVEGDTGLGRTYTRRLVGRPAAGAFSCSSSTRRARTMPSF